MSHMVWLPAAVCTEFNENKLKTRLFHCPGDSVSYAANWFFLRFFFVRAKLFWAVQWNTAVVLETRSFGAMPLFIHAHLSTFYPSAKRHHQPPYEWDVTFSVNFAFNLPWRWTSHWHLPEISCSTSTIHSVSVFRIFNFLLLLRDFTLCCVLECRCS